MTDTDSELADACRRAEQEAVAAIRARTKAASLAHEAMSLLHVARVRKLLRETTKPRPGAVSRPDEIEMLAV